MSESNISKMSGGRDLFYNEAPIGNDVWRIRWSCDWWRHVTHCRHAALRTSSAWWRFVITDCLSSFCVVGVNGRELLGQNPENIRRLMQQTVANELSPTRSPNNMMLITVVFQQSPDLAAKVLLMYTCLPCVHNSDSKHAYKCMWLNARLGW